MRRVGAVVVVALIGCGPVDERALPAPEQGAAKAAQAMDEPSLWPAEPYGRPINPEVPGVFCFRGNPQRNYVGEGPLPTGQVKVLWRHAVRGKTLDRWEGIGWTGQPVIVEWPESTRPWMNFINQPGPRLELICGSLNGTVVFLDADTGKPSRKPLRMPDPFPIKGTVSLHPRGFPLIYVGCGLKAGKRPGYRVFSLLDFKELLYLPAEDKAAPRKWPGSDSNALILDDTMILPSENGLLYRVRLNARWDPKTGKLGMSPKVDKSLLSSAGVEASFVVSGNRGFVPDNAGTLWMIDLTSDTAPVKAFALGDDTDATPVLTPQGDLIVGIEKDRRGDVAKGILYCLSQRNGQVVEKWRWSFEAESVRGTSPLNGGILSTAALYLPEKGPQLAIVTTSHHPKINQGRLAAVDLKTGKVAWQADLKRFSWSSPIVSGDAVFAADAGGYGHFFKASNGERLAGPIPLGGAVESSPIVWRGRVYVGTRGGAIVCLGNR